VNKKSKTEYYNIELIHGVKDLGGYISEVGDV
jgi:hypothetical protein